MALQSAMAVATLATGVAVGATLLKEYERRDAEVTHRVAIERIEAEAADRAARRAERDRARIERDRRRAAVERCRKDRRRAWERARRAGRWQRPREPRSCRRLEG